MTKQFSFSIIFFLLSIATFSQTPEVCKWEGDKQAAVVLTFDDWSPGHYPIVVPELNARGLQGTFYITTNSITSAKKTQLVEAASYGHEIGNHTVTHPQAAANIIPEVATAKEFLDGVVTSKTVLTFDYPYGTISNALIDTIRATGHIAARGVESPTNAALAYNYFNTDNLYYRIKSYGMSGSVSTKTFASYVTKAIAGNGLLTYLYHSVDNAANSHGDNWYAKVVQDSIQKQLDTLVALEDQIWVTTLANAVLYHREATNATLTEKEDDNDSTRTFTLTDTLDNSVYTYPLTIKVENASQNFACAVQAGDTLPLVARTKNYTLFSAIPDAGDIILVRDFDAFYDDLDTAIASAEKLDKNLYSEASWINLQDSLTIAKTVSREFADSLQTIVDSTEQQLLSALENLEQIVFVVTFKDYDGSVISIDSVDVGSTATAPAERVRSGYTFTGWNKDFSSVTETMTVTATYTEVLPIPVISANKPEISVTGRNIYIRSNSKEQISVFSVFGSLIKQSVGTCNATVPSPGLYFIKIADKSYKIQIH